MRRPEYAAAAALLLLAGCASPAARAPGLPSDLIRDDDGTVSGVWRDQRRLVATIDLRIRTFAAQSGCTISGGALVSLGQGKFRIDRYDSGYASDKCGPWTNGPAIAPFDGGEITLVRTGDRLVASGGGKTVSLIRVRR